MRVTRAHLYLMSVIDEYLISVPLTTNYHSGTHKYIFPYNFFFHEICGGPLGNCPACPCLNLALTLGVRPDVCDQLQTHSPTGPHSLVCTELVPRPLGFVVPLYQLNRYCVWLVARFCWWSKIFHQAGGLGPTRCQQNSTSSRCYYHQHHLFRWQRNVRPVTRKSQPSHLNSDWIHHPWS